MLPALPYSLEHVWYWFLELDSARGNNGYSNNPISYNEILSWAWLTGRKPSALEVDVLRRLDITYLSGGYANGGRRSSEDHR